MAERNVAMIVQVGGAIRKGYLRALETAEERQKRLGGALEGLRKQLGAVGAARELEASLAKLKLKQDAAGGSSEELAGDIRRVSEEYEAARERARGLGAEVGDLAGEHRRLTREAERAERQLKAMERRAEAGTAVRQRWGRSLRHAGAAYGVGRLVAGAAERQRGAMYLRTAFNPVAGGGALAAQVGGAVRAAREYARRSLASEGELLDISYALHSAGLDAAAADAGMRIVHQIATVTRGESAQVGETVATAFNVLGPRAGESAREAMERIGGVLTRTQLKFQFRDFGQLSESMNYAIDDAARYGVSLESTAAALGVLNSAGLQGSRAGTAFGAVMRNLGKASEELGFGLKRDADGMLDMEATLEALRGRIAHLDTDARAARIQDIFGDEGAAGLTPLLGMMDMLNEGVAELGDPAVFDAVRQNYLLFLNDSSGIWSLAKQNFQQAGDAWARSIEPATDAVGGALARAGAAAADMLDRYPRLGQAVAVAGVAFGGLNAAMIAHLGLTWAFPAAYGALTAAVAGFGRSALAAALNPIPALGRANTALRAGFHSTAGAARRAGAAGAGFGRSALAVALNPIPIMGRALGALRAGFAATATAIRVAGTAFLTNPIGWVALAIGAAAFAIVKYWAPVKAFFGGFFRGVKTGFGPVAGALKPIAGFVGSIVRWFGRLFKPVDANAEALAGAASAGEAFGKLVGGALKVMLWPIDRVIEGLGWIGRQVGRLAGVPRPGDAAVPFPGDAVGTPPPGAPARPRAPAVAGAVAAGLTLPAAAGPVDVDLATPDIESEVAGLTLPADVSESAARRPQGVATRTVNQTIHTINIHVQAPAGADVEAIGDEVERRIAESMRRAAAGAALAEDDLL